MKKSGLILILSLFSLISCYKSSVYIPEGLRKLTDEEILEGFRSNFIAENTVFKDSLGNVLSRTELQKIDPDDLFGDYYVSSNNELIEVVIRKATKQDKELIKKIKVGIEEQEPITIIGIDCSDIKESLETVYEADQENRQGGSVGNLEIDYKNQQIVVSTIENCGFPTVEEHGYKSVEAVFLVIQHAGKSLREKYFPQIKESADQGDLQWSLVALMEDRMLMDRGEKQKFGSQVIMKSGSNTWTLYPILDPENVNKRRAEIGLQPIEEYLQHFGIEYKND
ncbi:DUF6624 domain-containing protein [Algoriphagus sp. D3-2-R+10]|uniref:DUF6624 domain-containing protein n=1 Tax=Algoriphagus aurantiacus TaxID=3103948 RepID=UPI002B3D799E|nr:DUF6624 domain-containing protein [Algoriphagus sp. D3-2-R+10]MEB2777341.1 DUF6624 domain-containing protein [Algoriphagus sp. D3-2-R+10]